MALDPRAGRLLDMLATFGADRAHCDIEERRAAFRKLMALFGPVPSLYAVEDITMPGPGGLLRLRLYTPRPAAAQPAPGIVYFHGGGLVSGDLDTHDGLCRVLADQSGCRVVAVDYRLAPEHKFPAAVEDCGAALRWVFANASAMRIDPARIGVAGDSAGGTLAAVACQNGGDRAGIAPAFQLLLCPILDHGGETASRRTLAEGCLVDEATLRRDLDLYLPPGGDAADPRVSPLRASNFADLPPALIHTAEFDPLRDEALAYGTALRRAGVAAETTCHPGMIHLFYALGMVIPYAHAALRQIGGQIRAAVE
ncbi:MAG: alpha/beta hydrolase [Alphaproteobacteria bacterium]|nr:alpha/beta hydrolase [Alphaproteobacteria bacterium]